MCKNQVNRIIVKEMFDELLANKLNDLLPVGQTIATWVLGATDLAWLKREYHKMLDFFKDSPAYKWMTQDAVDEANEKIRQQLQRVLEKSRRNVVALVDERFPKLTRMAKVQVQATEDLETLQDAIFAVRATQDIAEVANILASLSGSDEN